MNLAPLLLQKLYDGATLLTPNHRLGRALHHAYQTEQKRLQRTFWLTPEILPFSRWLQTLWQSQDVEYKLLLNPLQEQCIWENIIAQEHPTLLRLAETANLAKSAWQLLKQWEIDVEHALFDTAEDYQAYRSWARRFQAQCTQEEWIDSATLAIQLCKLIQVNQIRLPKQIVLVGFTEIVPQVKTLLEACQQQDCSIVYFTEQKAVAAATACMQFNSLDEEIFTMARFAKASLAKTPTAKIACVIPNLSGQRDHIQHIFNQVFIETNTQPYNLSAGKALYDYPLVYTALELLSITQNLSANRLSNLLSSPFLGGAETEYEQRASLDATLKQKNIHRIDCHLFLQGHYTGQKLDQTCPILAQHLTEYLSCSPETKIQKRYSEWANFFYQRLMRLGFPGERSVNSEEYQTLARFLKLFEEFTSLDYVAHMVDHATALQKLTVFAKTTIFQIQTPDAPIQILGVLEAAGMAFDTIWLSNMNHITWPPAASPHPFIPKQLLLFVKHRLVGFSQFLKPQLLPRAVPYTG